MTDEKYVSRAGAKLEFALNNFKILPADKICADFGSNTGGFTDCLLQRGAKKVYAVETGYGVLAWKLRTDPRVVSMERTNAMHVTLPEKMDVITIDTSWTRLDKTIPNALANLVPDGVIIALVKLHYEAEPYMLRRGRLLPEYEPEVLAAVKSRLAIVPVSIVAETESAIAGKKGGNKEYLLLLHPTVIPDRDRVSTIQ